MVNWLTDKWKEALVFALIALVIAEGSVNLFTRHTLWHRVSTIEYRVSTIEQAFIHLNELEDARQKKLEKEIVELKIQLAKHEQTVEMHHAAKK